jgi:hypothetical protein
MLQIVGEYAVCSWSRSLACTSSMSAWEASPVATIPLRSRSLLSP